MKKNKKGIHSFIAVMASVILLHTLVGMGLLGFIALSYKTSEVSVITDQAMYDNVIGENVDEEYTFKMGEHEEIFPKSIDRLDVKDFKMVYYNPWDPQYIAYLVVEYTEDEYKKEMQRLSKFGIEDYYGEYGATGFGDNDLATINVLDRHYGMVYALNDDEKRTITYVELFFCDFFYSLDYTNYIDHSLLPEGFNASQNNEYMDKYLQEQKE